MLIRQSISDYKHIDFGNIKLAYTQICKDELFKDVYFAANALYYVEEGSALLQFGKSQQVKVQKGEIAIIKQHSKLNIRKFKGEDNKDFKSIIFYLFPDFVIEFLNKVKHDKSPSDYSEFNIINLGKHRQLQEFCESLKPMFVKPPVDKTILKQSTFEVLLQLSKLNKGFSTFLKENSKPIKIDLYEFMIHIAVNNYTVNELARLTGRSLSAFKRDFTSVFETTPHQWLLDKKIDYAEALIKEQKMKASEIYYMLGFNELSHFSSAFKKVKGVSPSQLQSF